MLGGVRTAMGLLGVVAAAAGCSSKSSTVPNPFMSADRVQPPMLRTTPGAPPYSPDAIGGPLPSTTFAPAPGAATAPLPSVTPYGAAPPIAAPPAYGAAPAYSPAYGAPTAPPSTYAPTTSTYAPGGVAPGPAPGMATPYYGAAASRGAIGGGDTITVQDDSGALRFASPAETQLARQSAAPLARPAEGLASNTPRRPATASGWIAGSAPVRNDLVAGSPRVRIPGEGFQREPVSLAAIAPNAGVRITPLEPSATGARPGEPTPLRVATPPSSTGWR